MERNKNEGESKVGDKKKGCINIMLYIVRLATISQKNITAFSVFQDSFRGTM